jgi:hypothetical protein
LKGVYNVLFAPVDFNYNDKTKSDSSMYLRAQSELGTQKIERSNVID